MSNSLGSLGSFQVQPEQPGQLTGMRYALNVPPAAGPKVGPQPPVEGAEKKTAPPAPVRRSAEQIAELIGDCDKAVSRLEKAAARGQSVPELIAQLKGELLNQLVAEALALESERAKASLAAIYAPRWRKFISRVETDRFTTVDAVRQMMNELVVTRESDFPAVARKIFEEVRNRFPTGPVCPRES